MSYGVTNLTATIVCIFPRLVRYIGNLPAFSVTATVDVANSTVGLSDKESGVEIVRFKIDEALPRFSSRAIFKT